MYSFVEYKVLALKVGFCSYWCCGYTVKGWYWWEIFKLQWCRFSIYVNFFTLFHKQSVAFSKCGRKKVGSTSFCQQELITSNNTRLYTSLHEHLRKLLFIAFSHRWLWSCALAKVPAGSKAPRPPKSSQTFISTASQSQLIAEMMQSHMTKDMCLIGAKVFCAFCTLITKTTHGCCALLSQWEFCISFFVCLCSGLRKVGGCKGVCCHARLQRRACHAVPGKWKHSSSCAFPRADSTCQGWQKLQDCSLRRHERRRVNS